VNYFFFNQKAINFLDDTKIVIKLKTASTYHILKRSNNKYFLQQNWKVLRSV